jgi:hypothetical protein
MDYDPLAQLQTVAPIINGLWRGNLPACFKPSNELVNDMNGTIFAAKSMPTYTQLREALAEALRHVPVRELAPLLPILQRAGGKL